MKKLVSNIAAVAKARVLCLLGVMILVGANNFAWAGSYETANGGGDWDKKPLMELKGVNDAGKLVYKWTYTGTLTMPTGLIFTWNNQGGRVDGSFTNHGYYTMGQLTRIAQYLFIHLHGANVDISTMSGDIGIE